MSEPTESRSSDQEPEELHTEYANNVAFEQTVWDLKLLFGEYSQRHNGVEWHTSITIPWAQAKLMLFYLTINVRSYELFNNRAIDIPISMLPAEPDPPPNPDDTKSVKLFEMITRYRQEFMDSQTGNP